MTCSEKVCLYKEAVAFYELAECGRNNIPNKKCTENYIPYIVNMSFCSELLLKMLLLEDGKCIGEVEKLSHNLKSLYNALNVEKKKMICEAFARPLIYNIEEEIEQVKKAFVEWRYLVLDKSKGNIKKLVVKPLFLKELNEVLLDICKNLI